MNTSIPKVYISYKFNIKKYKPNTEKIRRYIDIYCNIKFGSISKFLEKLKERQIVTDGISHNILETDDHIVLLIETDTMKPQEFIQEIQREILVSDLNEENFNRKKKISLSSCIYMSDNIFSLNNKIMSDIIDGDKVKYNIYQDIQNLNFEEYKTIINELDFSNTSNLIVEPKETE